MQQLQTHDPSPASRFAWLAGWFHPFRKLFTVIILIIVMELWVGHPGLRLNWRGRAGGVREMTTCQVISITGEKIDFYGEYKPLLCFVRPSKDRMLIYRICPPLANLIL